MLKKGVLLFFLYTLIWGFIFDAHPLPTLLQAWLTGRHAAFDGATLSAMLIAGAITIALFVGASLLMKLPAVQSFVKVAFGALETEARTAPAASTRESLAWLYGGMLFLLAMLVVLEWHQPLFFTQDDNFSLGLPNVLAACRNLLHGVFPAWNPYQLLGLPLASNPQSIYFYPPLLLCYLVSRYLLRNELFTTEVFYIVHLLLIYPATFCLARRLEMRPSIATLCGLSLVLSGYFLILGRSWGNVPVYLLLTIILASQTLSLCRREVNWTWMAQTGAAIGLFWYLGNAQLWIYAVGLFLLSLIVLALSGALPWRRMLWIVPALCLGAAIAAPLLMPQLRETAQVIGQREVGAGEGIEFGVVGMLLPYPMSALPYGQSTVTPLREKEYGPFLWWWDTNFNYFGELFYSGTLFYLIGFVCLIFAFAFKFSQRLAEKNHWLLMALLTGLYALGPPGILWSIVSLLPYFNKMRGPFKLLGFVNLFVMLGAGLVLERLVRHYRPRAIILYALVGVVAVLLLYHCSLPLPAFYQYGDRSYPPLPAQYQAIVTASRSPYPQRTLSVGLPDRDPREGFVYGLHLNFATPYRIPSVNGYDPLYQNSTQNSDVWQQLKGKALFAAARAYGVQWMIVSAETPPTFPADAGRDIKSRTAIASTLPMKLTLVELQAPDPLAFMDGDPRHALPIALRGDGADITLPAMLANRRVTLNFLARPFLKVFTDGGQELICAADGWQRVTVVAPRGAHTLRLRYCAPWSAGLPVAATCLILSLVSGWLLWRRPAGWAYSRCSSSEDLDK